MAEKEYIERERIAVDVLGLTIVDPMVAQYADAVLLKIQQAPAADVAPVVHGRWTSADNISKKAGCVRHAECEINPYRLFGCKTDYCPCCGARMDGAPDTNVGHTIPVKDLYDEEGGEIL